MTRNPPPHPAEPRPPAWAEALLRRFLPDGLTGRSVLADLEQEFLDMARDGKAGAARRWYSVEALKLAGHVALEPLRYRSPRNPAAKGGWGIDRLARNMAFSFRRLRRAPGFAALAILTMSLGIGAAVAIFSVVNVVLLDPLPYRDADRLVAIFEWNQPRDRQNNVANPGNFRAWRDRSETFADMSAVSLLFPATVTAAGEPEESMIQYAEPDFFQVLGLDAEVGRTFLADPGALEADEALLSHRYWIRRFGGDPSVVGRSIQVDGTSMNVVGVLPPYYVAFGEGTDLWVGTNLTEGDQTNSGRWMWVVGRLADGASLPAARSELEAVAASLQEEFPDFNAGWTVNLVPLKTNVVGDVSTALWILLGAVGLLLLISCTNVANLFLVQATRRQKEMAIRSSLGASRSTLVVQLLTESLTVAGAGAAVGVWAAHLSTRALAAGMPDAFALPRVEAAGVDGTVLLFAVALTVLTGLLFGIVPALQAFSTAPSSTLNAETRGPSRRTGMVRNALVVSEVALSLVLLAGAALLGRSLTTLLGVDPGFEPGGVLAGRVNLSGPAYEEDASKVAFFTELLDRLGSQSGVEAAGGITFLPMDGLGAATGFYPLDRPAPAPEDRPAADIRNVAGDYFAAMGIDLLEGRVFDRRDGPDGRRTAVVNRALAEEFWPSGSALGKPLFISWETDEPWEIVGVVEDVRMASLDQVSRGVIYLHYPKTPYFSSLQVVVRSTGDPAALAPTVRAQVAAMDPTLPVGDVRAMNQVVRASTARPRMTAFLMGLFAVLATILAAVGLYGVLSYSVSQRIREIGVRVAVGAGMGDVLGLVVGQGARLVLLGIGAGMLVALAGGRLLRGLLFEVHPHDPPALFAAVGLLFLVGLIACTVPAFRASRLDPSKALNSE